MKVNREVPDPSPPKLVVITMTEQEAGRLRAEIVYNRLLDDNKFKTLAELNTNLWSAGIQFAG